MISDYTINCLLYILSSLNKSLIPIYLSVENKPFNSYIRNMVYAKYLAIALLIVFFNTVVAQQFTHTNVLVS